ncbi:vacuolar protein sorting-associated protein 32 2 isoform X1 [Cinnamomum micranthum f. kanehirae]|uniref:Vacuolar protein sorting-associated protein 32 2 isoform X1 n=1 Tax=Cinnamomum micranthum f. kanehirae TaxID=337451 RepID=A0A3S3QZM3_9MAGN|nr:vacuolar protein sorting-associated protein 32 2 isoform X1 [Cinnamomum micranthum f. kanehirae]
MLTKKKKAPPSAISTLDNLNEVCFGTDFTEMGFSFPQNATIPQFVHFCCLQTLEMLEKKEHVLQKKISVEIERAKKFTQSKNKKGGCSCNVPQVLVSIEFPVYRSTKSTFSAAIQCLKKKKLFEAQIEQLANFQLRVHDQVSTMIMLEGVKATTDTVDALKTGASAIKSIQFSL